MENNPCEQCIVSAMCSQYCEDFKLYVEDTVLSTCPDVSDYEIERVCGYMISESQLDMFKYCDIAREYQSGIKKQWKSRILENEYFKKYFKH